MATPKCPKCDGTSFENSGETRIKNYGFPLNLIGCAKCGAVVGVTPAADPGVMGELNKAAIAELQKSVVRLEAAVAALLSRSAR